MCLCFIVHRMQIGLDLFTEDLQVSRKVQDMEKKAAMGG
jgi:hypothetical protein